jgi:hypothetical protein
MGRGNCEREGPKVGQIRGVFIAGQEPGNLEPGAGRTVGMLRRSYQVVTIAQNRLGELFSNMLPKILSTERTTGEVWFPDFGVSYRFQVKFWKPCQAHLWKTFGVIC